MSLPPDIDLEGAGVDDSKLSLLDEKILTILRESESPVLTSTEIAEGGAKKSRRTVHNQLEELDEELGLVAHKRAGGSDRSPKVWWIRDEVLITEEDTPPERDEIITGLDAMESHERKALRDEFSEFNPHRPELPYRSFVAIIGGFVWMFFTLMVEIAQSNLSFDLISDITTALLIGFVAIVAGVIGSLSYAISSVESQYRSDDRFGELAPRILHFDRYTFGIGVLSATFGILTENLPFLDLVSDSLFGIGIVLVTLSLSVLAIAWVWRLFYNNQYLPFSISS